MDLNSEEFWSGVAPTPIPKVERPAPVPEPIAEVAQKTTQVKADTQTAKDKAITVADLIEVVNGADLTKTIGRSDVKRLQEQGHDYATESYPLELYTQVPSGFGFESFMALAKEDIQTTVNELEIAAKSLNEQNQDSAERAISAMRTTYGSQFNMARQSLLTIFSSKWDDVLERARLKRFGGDTQTALSILDLEFDDPQYGQIACPPIRAALTQFKTTVGSFQPSTRFHAIFEQFDNANSTLVASFTSCSHFLMKIKDIELEEHIPTLLEALKARSEQNTFMSESIARDPRYGERIIGEVEYVNRMIAEITDAIIPLLTVINSWCEVYSAVEKNV